MIAPNKIQKIGKSIVAASMERTLLPTPLKAKLQEIASSKKLTDAITQFGLLESAFRSQSVKKNPASAN